MPAAAVRLTRSRDAAGGVVARLGAQRVIRGSFSPQSLAAVRTPGEAGESPGGSTNAIPCSPMTAVLGLGLLGSE